MGTDKLTIEHRDAQMNLYKIKKYDTINIRYGSINMTLFTNMWIGYDYRYREYVICAANPCEIQRNDSRIISNNIVLTFTNEDDRLNSSLHLCCNSEESAITFDQKELRWKICISAVQPEFVKDGLRELFDDAESAYQNFHISMNYFYGLSSNVLGHASLEDRADGVYARCSLDDSRNMLDIRIGLLEIKDVIFNPPATIVFWEDGTKTVVKAQEEDFDREKGLAMAITKKALGNEGRYYETIKKWIKKWE